jgi:chaperonin GroES
MSLKQIEGEKMNIKPMQDRLLVKPANEELKTASGIIVPDTAAKEKPMRGEVLAAGPGKLSKEGVRIPMDIKVGDKVLYGKYAGTEFKLEDDDLLIIEQSDVLAILEN